MTNLIKLFTQSQENFLLYERWKMCMIFIWCGLYVNKLHVHVLQLQHPVQQKEMFSQYLHVKDDTIKQLKDNTLSTSINYHYYYM